MVKPRTITAILVASIASALCIGGIHLLVRFRIAKINQDPRHWIHLARTDVYGLCYDGCDDCLEVDSIFNACAMTASVDLPGVICDASSMWTWADKYPLECLSVVGQIVKGSEIQSRRRWYWLCVLVPLMAIPLGLGVRSVLRDRGALNNWPAWAVQMPQPRHRPHIHVEGAHASARTPLLTAGSVSVLALAFFAQIQSVDAGWGNYPCLLGAASNQYFTHETVDGPLFGVVHGWLSTCYQETYTCGESCTTDSSTRTCTTNDCTRERLYEPPRSFVLPAMRRIQRECGFTPVISVPVALGQRIANANIERLLSVGVWVDRFNGSDGVYPEIQCLYNHLVEPQRSKHKPAGGLFRELSDWWEGRTIHGSYR